jgi:hypothetical protein
MRIYLSFAITSIVNFWVIITLLGVSGGFANYAPELALLGIFILFSIALPILIYKKTVGIIMGSLGCLLVLPFNIMFIKTVIQEQNISKGIVVAAIPFILTITSVILILQFFFRKKTLIAEVKGSRYLKMLLASTPIILFFLYLFFYGKNWIQYLF